MRLSGPILGLAVSCAWKYETRMFAPSENRGWTVDSTHSRSGLCRITYGTTMPVRLSA